MEIRDCKKGMEVTSIATGNCYTITAVGEKRVLAKNHRLELAFDPEEIQSAPKFVAGDIVRTGMGDYRVLYVGEERLFGKAMTWGGNGSESSWRFDHCTLVQRNVI